MTDGDNGHGTIVTPQDVLSEHAARQRRLRKPTIGEVEDAMNDFAAKMLQQYGPLAVALREASFRISTLEREIKMLKGTDE